MIELLQVSQSRRFFPAFSPEAIAAEIDRGNPVMVGLRTIRNEQHNIIIYGYEKDEESYQFDVYDNSDFVTKITYNLGIMAPYASPFSLSYKKTDYVFEPYDYCTVDMLLDLFNDIKRYNRCGAASLLEGDTENDVWLFCPTENMTITNSDGQSVTITDGELSDGIDDVRLVLSGYLAEEPTYTIIMPTDTISGSSTMSMTTDDLAVTVTPQTPVPVTISANLHNITIDAKDNDEYSVTYTTYGNIYDEMTLSGIACGNMTISMDEAGQISVAGAKTLQVSATVSEEPVSVETTVETSVTATVRCSNDGEIQILSDNTPLTESVALASRVKVSAPQYNLAGGTYSEGQLLTFAKDDETLVYYTTDGTTPTVENGFLYTLPIEINHSMTVKAVASKYGYADSEVVELTYTLPSVTAPTSNYSSGHYDQPLYVDLYAEDDTEIYYTTDGGNPLTDGIPFGASIVLTTDTTITACAVKNGCVSDVVAYVYMISPESTLMLSNTPVNQNSEVITAENLADLSKVTLVVENLSGNAQDGIFMVAFYRENGRFISVDSQIATINREGNVVEVGITGDVSAASRMKVFILDSAYRPLSEATVVSFNSEN